MKLPVRLLVLILVFLSCGSTAWAWQESSEEDLQIRLGFDGIWKLGHVTPLEVELSPTIKSRVKTLQVSTVDGDGVKVAYQNALVGQSGSPIWGYFRSGRNQTELSVAALDAEGIELASVSEPAISALDSSQPLVVALGNSMGIEDLSRTSTETNKQNFTTAVLGEADAIPDSWRCFSGCDLMVLSCSNVEFLRSLSDAQWQAVDNWIRRGGGCIISLSGKTDISAYEIEGLAKLLPGKVIGNAMISDPGLLESLVATDEPLAQMSAANIELQLGNAELTMRDSLSKDVPWWISYSYGHGTIQLVASDLGGEAIGQWKDRKLLWGRLVDDYFESSILDSTTTEKEASDSSYLGYSDLVGQLRATLDVFPTIQSVSFGQISLALIVVLLLVGPLDYFISVRWLKRPDVSWYFSSVVLALISIGLVLFYNRIRPDTALVNSAQIVDVDVATGRVQGRVWSHIYSGNAHRYDVSCSERNDASVYLDWQGLPGNGLGGLNSQLNTDRGIPPYQIEVSGDDSIFRNAGISAGGTKCLVGSWTTDLDIRDLSTLSEIPGVDQLTGEIVNPLEVDLRDSMLFYHNWFYRLNSRIPSGSSYSISFETIPKDSSRRLNGRQTVDGTDAITRWSPADRNSLDRLLELMMFHKAASGESYTSLSHRYQPRIDQSNLLNTDKAILIGWLDEPWAVIEAEPADGSGIEIQQSQNRTWCRIAIPVSKPKSNR